ncbi:protein TRC8 homolog [Metopolophium dirhodum]|uniref:protein TRC8 homolog n=2 Tax=Metopolophium dirhodum TaxID=44670 RepID=UPI00298F5976|nr:protein TRC8 homolog [Metopolophium dirhodum]XP_060858691.1 protein TRC8 homolog [Metopolophium dirhodum]
MDIMSFYNLLRVPLIFIVDELFKSSFGLPELADIMFPVNSTLNQIEIGQSTQYYAAFIKIIVSCLIFFSSLCLLTLPVRYLIPVYLYVVSICVVLFSYWQNMETLGFLSGKYKNFKIETTNELITRDVDEYMLNLIQLYPRLYKLFHSIILQYCLSLIFDILQVFTTDYSIHKIFRYSFIIPTLIASIPNTSSILNTVIILSTLMQLFILLIILLLNIFHIINLIQSEYNDIQEILNDYGIFTLVEMEWYRLEIPSVLRMFWAIRVLIQFLYLSINTEIKNSTLFETVKYLSIKGCDTCTAVLGMTSILSYFCNNIGAFFQWVLMINELDDLNCGVLTAVLFSILAMQSGLTGLDPENRFIKLYQNVHLVCISLQDYIYNMVEKSLIYLNGSHNRSLNRHSRALLVCGGLIAMAVISLHLVLSYHSVSHWLLAVSVLNILSLLKVLVSLAVYSLLLIDSNSSTYSENIDDYVYYIKSFGSILEFCFCIFLSLNDIYNWIFVSGGVIRAIVICSQAYFKMCLVKKGWRIFIKRRTAMKKVESLPDATSVQLSEFDDICAICYQEMRSAKITNCNHYFHSECLRKWTYLRDECPLCHSICNNAEM